MRVGVGGSHKAVLPRGIEDELTPPALTRCTTNKKIISPLFWPLQQTARCFYANRSHPNPSHRP